MQATKATKTGINSMITKMIKYSDKAPKNLRRYQGVTKGEVKKQKMKLPWTLIIVVGAIIIIVALYILWKSKTKGAKEGVGYAPGDKLNEPVDLKGRDIEGLLDEFGYT